MSDPSQTLDQLTKRVKEAITIYLESECFKPKEGIKLVGLQFVEVPTN